MDKVVPVRVVNCETPELSLESSARPRVAAKASSHIDLGHMTSTRKEGNATE